MRSWIVPAALGVLLLVVSIAAVGSLSRANRFEVRAVAAEQFVKAQRVQIDLLEDTARHLRARAAKRDTLIDTLTVEIAVADAAADTSAMFAARDRLIGEQKSQISDLKSENLALREANSLFRASNDTLAAALAARATRFPLIQVGAGAFVALDGQIRPGIGVTIPLRTIGKVFSWL